MQSKSLEPNNTPKTGFLEMQSSYFVIFKIWCHYSVRKTKLFFDEKIGKSCIPPLRAVFVIIIIMSVEILDIYKCPAKELELFWTTF
jgi:hypothetical protein